MKKTKNFIVLLLAALMLTVFIGCAPDTPAEPAEPQERPSEIKTEPLRRIEDKMDIADALVVTDIYVGGSNIKFIAIKNISDKAVSLKDYALEANTNLSTIHNNNFVSADVMLNPGVTVYAHCIKADEMEAGLAKNNIPNFANLPIANGEEAGTIEKDSSLYANMILTVNGNDPIKFMKGETVLETINCDDQGKKAEECTSKDKSVLGAPQKSTYYSRVFTVDDSKATAWNVYATADEALAAELNARFPEAK